QRSAGFTSAGGFGARASAVADVRPALADVLPDIIWNGAEGEMVKSDERAAFDFAQAVLHIRDDRIGHEQRPADLQQGGALDGLHGSPEMAVAIAEVTIPAATGPRLQFHGQRLAFGCVGRRAELLEQRGEGGVERSANARLHADIEDQVFDSWCCRYGCHRSSL